MLSRSKLARPNIRRLSILILWLWPSCDCAGAMAQAEAGGDGVEDLGEAGHEGVHGRQVVGLDDSEPVAQVPALVVVHELGECADLIQRCGRVCCSRPGPL